MPAWVTTPACRPSASTQASQATSWVNISDTAVRRSALVFTDGRDGPGRARRRGPAPVPPRPRRRASRPGGGRGRPRPAPRRPASRMHRAGVLGPVVLADARRVAVGGLADRDQAQALQGAVAADEIGDEGVRRMGQDVVGAVELLELAGAEDRDLVAHLHGLVDVVADEQDGLPQASAACAGTRPG